MNPRRMSERGRPAGLADDTVVEYRLRGDTIDRTYLDPAGSIAWDGADGVGGVSAWTLVTPAVLGWRDWHGGECPVPPETRVDVILRRAGKLQECIAGGVVWADRGADGDIVQWRRSDARPASWAPVSAEIPEPDNVMTEPGYERLAAVLQRAYNQAAAYGKGKGRHAQGEPFTDQVMQDGARRFGVGALLFQAFKKSDQSQRLPLDRAVVELLGAINYLAAAVITLEGGDK